MRLCDRRSSVQDVLGEAQVFLLISKGGFGTLRAIREVLLQDLTVNDHENIIKVIKEGISVSRK